MDYLGKYLKTSILVFGCFFVLEALLSNSAGQFAYGADGATLSGVVKLEGARPRRRPIRTDADIKCKAMHAESPLLSDEMVVNEAGQVRHVFVYIKNPPEGDFPVPTEPAVLNQKNCTYTPHVQGIRAGQPLDIVNSDDLVHNVRSFPRRNRPFNLGQPTPGVRTKSFTKPEKAIKFKCDVHKWMTSYVFAMDHPFFATTDENGQFKIENVPAGEYTLVAWHERFGELKLEVSFSETDVDSANFVYVPPEK